VFATGLNSNAILAIVAVLGAMVAASRWAYTAMSRYFDGLTIKKSFGSRLATVETDVGAVKEDVGVIKESVAVLVADSQTNGSNSAADHRKRMEEKLDKLLEAQE
jgi:hypothetical protein